MSAEGELASQYSVLEELGSGSFGTVYKAIDKYTGEVVAIKHIDLESSEDDILEIQQEISVLSTCASPFVTQYKASFLRGHKLWIVMEYLGGGSCLDLLKPGSFNEAHIAIICRELLLGLEYLHQEGKIHRDIKAANVLLSTTGKVKLADFGVAAQLTNIKSQRNTFVGTPFWMAPEVIQQAGYDFKADIWSLGITAMELVNGEPPNASIHPMKVLFHIPKAPAPRLEGSNYSKDFKDFVAQCLVKDCDRRPSAKELLRHRFVRSAGKVEALQELIERKQEWDGGRHRPSHPRFYEETMKHISPRNEPDEWVFDTVKAATIAPRKNTSKRRKLSVIHANGQGPQAGVEEVMKRLDLQDSPLEYSSPPPLTVRKSTMRRRSSVVAVSPTKQRQESNTKKPLQPDMNFGNAGSTVRLFRRVSNNSVTAPTTGECEPTTLTHDESRPPMAETVTKDAVLGRRVFNKIVDPCFQELHAQTSNQAKRDALSRVADAWSALDAVDPEGEYQLLKAMIERVQAEPKLSSLLKSPTRPSTATSRPSTADSFKENEANIGTMVVTPSKPTPSRPTSSYSQPGTVVVTPQKQQVQPNNKLVLAQNNPHLKSHRKRQSSLMPEKEGERERERLHNLPGQAVQGMEHTKQLADVLYGRWADGLRMRWPAV